MAEQLIECPKCGEEFPVTKALAESIESRVRDKYQVEAEQLKAGMQEDYDGRLVEELDKAKSTERAKAEKEASKQIAALNKALEKANKREKKTAQEFARKLEEKKEEMLAAARTEASEGSAGEIKKLKRQVREGKKEIREMVDREEAVTKKETRLTRKEKGFQKKIDTAVGEAVENATESILRDARLKNLEHHKIVGDLNKKLDEAKAKIAQSSQELKGEVFELEIEKTLAGQFPQDRITPVKKGVRGADINHEILTSTGNLAGTIIWETKNTKNWAKTWISKLKADQRKINAELAVIVSKALPSGMESRFDFIEGVWVCEYSVVPGLALVLRMSILEAYRLKQSAHGKDEKMEILYQYLMSTEFKQRVESMVESFTEMKKQLDKERTLMQKSWAERETQINQVVGNIAGMVGDIQARAPAFPTIERLQLPEPE